MDLLIRHSNPCQVAPLLEEKYNAKTQLNKFSETLNVATSDSVKSAENPKVLIPWKNLKNFGRRSRPIFFKHLHL